MDAKAMCSIYDDVASGYLNTANVLEKEVKLTTHWCVVILFLYAKTSFLYIYGLKVLTGNKSL